MLTVNAHKKVVIPTAALKSKSSREGAFAWSAKQKATLSGGFLLLAACSAELRNFESH